ncbi:iron-siderophore ABC transporter substrate-binding protein [Janibacter indicus]|uniref:Iron ABC transporter substrate-binding protein n=1 Tax=Janibacter indicus TaxID=857417 RepID=A0A1L3MHM6_9MICO|nr:iron-siderophore ABC transporter substrate-binding protein [Janibacter indicus]APH01865.1 iron ABC transporter substrate-binding protein [Janibacter indicus]QOK21797.1 iron-siderophore ABC transporter substrate-binding protein [Janibacter indicus]
MPLTRLRATTTALLLATPLALAGCGSDSGSDADATSGGDGAFPVSIKSSLGTAEITEKPEKVVTLGQGSTETSIALGTIPVGMEEYAWAADKSGYTPWVNEAVKDEGGELPEFVGAGEELDMEKIVELEPDVILAPWSGITQEQYDSLSEIAPTVAYPDQAWSIDWDEQIEIIGQALGQEDDAAKLVTDLEKQLADEAKKHPDWKNYTFSYVYTTPDTLGVFKPTEQRADMVRKLGLKSDPAVDKMKETEGTDSAVIGYENADKLNDSDLIFTFYSDPKAKKQAMSNKLYASIPAIKAGAVVSSDDNSFVTASSMINPLTVPYALETYPEMIDAAIAKADTK